MENSYTPFQRNILAIILLIIASFLLYQIKDILLLFYTSFVVASAINPVVDILSKRMSRGAAVAVIFLVGLVSIILFLIPLSDMVIKQTMDFINNLPVYWSNFSRTIHNIRFFDIGLNALPSFSQIISSAVGVGKDVFSRSLDITINAVSGLAISFTLAILVLYMVLDKDSLKRGYLKLFPVNTRDKAESILMSISKKVGGFVVGQALSMAIIAILTTIGLALIGVNYSILLGTITGLMDIIPVVGPILALGLIVLVAFAEKPIIALWAILIFSFIQWLTNTFSRPYIFSRFLDLHPLIIIFALFVAGSMLGVVGVILSPAIAVTVYVLIQELYIKRINHAE